ncbi:MAG: inverse autotransporter beta domain-containing protein, partial [Gammaproteobacteria bacterium]|nr:inverse autotransporter beta domain-containing protein [Gammaproteobacteria bacterium]
MRVRARLLPPARTLIATACAVAWGSAAAEQAAPDTLLGPNLRDDDQNLISRDTAAAAVIMPTPQPLVPPPNKEREEDLFGPTLIAEGVVPAPVRQPVKKPAAKAPRVQLAAAGGKLGPPQIDGDITPTPKLMEPLTAQSDEKEWHGYLESRLHRGEGRTIGTLDWFQPLQQDENSLTFLDVRGLHFSGGSNEYNVGFGHRRINPDGDRITGVYGFLDSRHTERGNQFDQATFGFESLGTWDVRANVYIPVSERKQQIGSSLNIYEASSTETLVDRDTTIYKSPVLDPAGHNVYLQHGRIDTTTTVTTTHTTTSVFTQNYEVSMRGYDVEVGRELPFLKNINLRGYLGAYHFEGPEAETAKGLRARLEARVHEYVTFGLESQKDDVFGTQNFAELRLRLPLGKPRKTTTNGDAGPEAIADPLRARMTDQARRDINVVVTDKVTPDVATTVQVDVQKDVSREKEYIDEPVRAFNDRLPVEIFYVDNTGSGSAGTVENPAKRLKDAENFPYPDIVYVYRGDGTSTNYDQGLNLYPNTRLLGEGVPLTIFGFTDSGAVIINKTLFAAGEAPVVTNTSGNAVTLADLNEVAGITFSQTKGNGIYGENITGWDIHDNSFETNFGSGISLVFNKPGEYQGSVYDNVFKSNRGPAASVVASDAANVFGDFTDNVFRKNPVGIIIKTSESAEGDFEITTNKFIGNGYGIIGTAADSAQLATRIAGNSFSDNSSGILHSGSGDSNLQTTIFGNTFSGGIDGITSIASESSTLDAHIFGNEMHEGEGTALTGLTAGSATLNLTVVDNFIDNGNAAASNTATGDSTLTFLFDDNTVLSNESGITNTATNSATLYAALFDNVIADTNDPDSTSAGGVQANAMLNLSQGDSLLMVSLENNTITSNENGIFNVSQQSSTLAGHFSGNLIADNTTSDVDASNNPKQAKAFYNVALDNSTMDLSNTFSNNTITSNEIGISNLADDDATISASYIDNLITDNATGDVKASGGLLGAGAPVQGAGVTSTARGSGTITNAFFGSGALTGNTISSNENGIVNIANSAGVLYELHSQSNIDNNRSDDVKDGAGVQGTGVKNIATSAGFIYWSGTSVTINGNEAGASNISINNASLDFGLENSTVIGNTTDDLRADSTGIAGGAISNVVQNGASMTATLDSSTVSSNETGISNSAADSASLIFATSATLIADNRTDDLGTSGGIQGAAIKTIASGDAVVYEYSTNDTISGNESGITRVGQDSASLT